MPYDYTDAPPQLIPHGTIATCVLHLRPGSVGEDGMLKRSKDGGCEMLDCEFTVADGPYKGRKWWGYMILTGTTAGHAQAAEISRGTLRAIIESNRGIKPDDTSPQARTARTVSLKDFDNLAFIGKIGIEKGGAKSDGGGNYPDKNILLAVITPDKKEWHPVEQPPPFNGGGGGAQAASPSAAPPIERPGWAS